MVRKTIYPSKLAGELTATPSKSQTLRALLFAAFAHGTSRIDRVLQSPDVFAMIEALKLFGAKITVSGQTVFVEGTGGVKAPVQNVIECGNSGIILRFLGAMASLLPTQTVFTGDVSIRTRRPVQPLIDAITGLGGFAASAAPLIVRGPWVSDKTSLDGADSQPVSGLLIAGALGPHPIELEVKNPGETPWVDLTVHWLHKLGLFCEKNTDYTQYKLLGNGRISAFEYKVPGDFSTAAFPIAAALMTDSELVLHELDWSEPQGDKEFISIVQQMGARIEIRDRTVTVRSGGNLRGQTIDVNRCIDALPILAVLGCKATGTTRLVNGHMARHKESDRIAEMARVLRAMGATVEERLDGLVITQSTLRGAELNPANDHRVVLALAAAALGADGPTTLHGTQWAAKTYPTWETEFRHLGAKIE